MLTEVGLYVFEMPSAKKKNERGALLLMIPIETVNGVLLESVKKKHFLVLPSFFKDHRFLCESEAAACEWRRLLAAAMVGRRKQATIRNRGAADRMSLRERAVEAAQDIRDVEAARNEETNALLQAYLEKRTQCLDELMRRELWAVREQAAAAKGHIAALLARRAGAAAPAPSP